jgi:predicted RNase H-like HicB family nuclease
MNATDYPVLLTWSEQDEAYIARVFDLPGCAADGKTPAEAIENVRLSIEEWIETAKDMGFDVPAPQDDTVLEEFARKQNQEQLQRFQEAVQAEVQKAIEKLIPQLTEMFSTGFPAHGLPMGKHGYTQYFGRQGPLESYFHKEPA